MGLLEFSNCLFTEWRFRPNWVINISGGGTARLTNVDFTNMEPGKWGHSEQYLYNLPYQNARGVITSFSSPKNDSDYPEGIYDQMKE